MGVFQNFARALLIIQIHMKYGQRENPNKKWVMSIISAWNFIKCLAPTGPQI